MAAPFGLEDLEKLKSFIDFVAENPLILNLPQLGFFKRFIEKLGGVVPEGEFQMPAGGKCPFGGDVKSETKSTATPPPTAEPEDDGVEAPEMEAESEESEVELDMEDNNINIAEPNIVYLNEKPPKIVKNKKTKAKKTKKPSKKKEPQKTKKKLRSVRKVTEKLQDNIVKNENDVEEKLENMDTNDPLFTAPVEIKCELNDEKMEPEVKLQYDDDEYEVDDKEDIKNIDKDYVPNEQEEEISNDEEDYTDNEDDFVFGTELQKIDLSSNEDDEDEPLIMLMSGKPKKYQCKEKAPKLINCGCKRHCNEKFTEEERKRICAYFWNLHKPQKIDFLRKCIKARRFTKYKFLNVDRKRKNCCNLYYLTNCIKNQDGEDILHSDSASIKVCYKFFETTLCVTGHYLKKILSGYELELEKDLELLVETIRVNKEKELEKSQQLKQVLDPETGNLVTIDPKDKKKKYKYTKPKEKRKRRRPGDPIPEHFPKPISCSVRCLYKCHTKFTEQERKQICDIFWSMDFKHRKDYVLENIEKKETIKQVAPEYRTTNRPPRTYTTHHYLRTSLLSEKKRVCQHFMVNTLSVNKNYISDAIEHADKNTGYYTKDVKRVVNITNTVSPERTQMLVDHVNSYPTWVPNKKSKIKYLHHTLTIKKIFEEYLERCKKENIQPVGRHYFYKYYHKNFRLLFLATPVPQKGFMGQNPNISRYTGEEPGGFWSDPSGERLDVGTFNPAQNMHTCQTTSFNKQHEQNFSMASNSSQDSFTANITNTSTSLQLNPLNYTTSAAAAAAQHLANFIDPTVAPTSTLNSRAIAQSSLVRLDLNPNLYDNLPHGSSNMFRML